MSHSELPSVTDIQQMLHTAPEPATGCGGVPQGLNHHHEVQMTDHQHYANNGITYGGNHVSIGIDLSHTGNNTATNGSTQFSIGGKVCP